MASHEAACRDHKHKNGVLLAQNPARALGCSVQEQGIDERFAHSDSQKASGKNMKGTTASENNTKANHPGREWAPQTRPWDPTAAPAHSTARKHAMILSLNPAFHHLKVRGTQKALYSCNPLHKASPSHQGRLGSVSTAIGVQGKGE